MKRVGFTLLAVSVALMSGCSSDPVIVDKGYNLIDELEVVRVEPTQYAVGDTVEIDVAISVRYRGKGRYYVSGRAGGNDVGVLVYPMEINLGEFQQELKFQEGRNVVSLAVRVEYTGRAVGFNLSAVLDSLFVGDELVYWQSPEGYSVYEADIPPDTMFLGNSVYRALTIYRAN